MEILVDVPNGIEPSIKDLQEDCEFISKMTQDDVNLFNSQHKEFGVSPYDYDVRAYSTKKTPQGSGHSDTEIKSFWSKIHTYSYKGKFVIYRMTEPLNVSIGLVPPPCKLDCV